MRLLVLGAALVLSACSGSGSSSVSQAPLPTTTIAAELPRVDLIDEAVSALEARLGGPQQYFEINATSQLVNLFVALNDANVVQPWVYHDGDLSSSEGSEAGGFTFARDALDFEPDKVLRGLQVELPQASVDVFFVEGGAGGTVQYSVAVTSQQGGQLVVVVGPDGAVRSVVSN